MRKFTIKFHRLDLVEAPKCTVNIIFDEHEFISTLDLTQNLTISTDLHLDFVKIIKVTIFVHPIPLNISLARILYFLLDLFLILMKKIHLRLIYSDLMRSLNQHKQKHTHTQ
jgi:hypothetical protein